MGFALTGRAIGRGKAAAVTRPLRLCLIGSGAIASRVAELIFERQRGTIELVGVGVQPGVPPAAWWPASARRLTNPDEMAETEPDIVLEAASRAAVGEWGRQALQCARKLIICSASALTDDTVLASLRDAADAFGSQLVVAHGALGGVQALSAAALLELDTVSHTIRKPPLAWKGTPAEALIDLAGVTASTVLFEGAARDAARNYPANANAVVLTSLAGLGLDRTRVLLVADPEVRRNVHEIKASGAFGDLHFRIENEAMASNPKTSDMTALSLVRLLETETGAMLV